MVIPACLLIFVSENSSSSACSIRCNLTLMFAGAQHTPGSCVPELPFQEWELLVSLGDNDLLEHCPTFLPQCLHSGLSLQVNLSQLNTAGEGPPALRTGPRECSRTSSHSTLTLDSRCVYTRAHTHTHTHTHTETHTVPSMENFIALVLVCRFLCFYRSLSVISAFLPFRNSSEFLAAFWLVWSLSRHPYTMSFS